MGVRAGDALLEGDLVAGPALDDRVEAAVGQVVQAQGAAAPVEIVSGYSVFRNSRNCSSTNGYMKEASPLSSPMKPSIEQATK